METNSTTLNDAQRRYLADQLLGIWQAGMRSTPMSWDDFLREATHIGLGVLSRGATGEGER